MLPEVEIYSPLFGKNLDLIAVLAVMFFILFNFAKLKKYIPPQNRMKVAAGFFVLMIIVIANM